jgi:hypothetical protein
MFYDTFCYTAKSIMYESDCATAYSPENGQVQRNAFTVVVLVR